MRSNRRSNYRFSIVLIAVFLATASSARSQTPSPTPSPTPSASATPSLESQFFKNILRDQKAIWTAPFHLERHDAKWIAPLGLGTMALITTDRRTGDKMAKFHAQLKPSRLVSYPGSTYGAGGVAASFYLIGRATHNERARETGLLSAEALVDSVVVGMALKAITQRARPLAGSDRSEFFEGGTSFPSGHSIQAWSVATVIAHEYHDHRMVQVAAYGIASAVSVARFTGRKHYLSDVLVGSALGYGIGRYVYRTRHRKSLDSADPKEERPESRWPLIAPRYDRRARQYGVTLAWSF